MCLHGGTATLTRGNVSAVDYAVCISSGGSATASGCTFKGWAGGEVDVHREASVADLERCIFHNSGQCWVLAHDGAKVNVRSCKSSGNHWGFAALRHARMELTSCKSSKDGEGCLADGGIIKCDDVYVCEKQQAVRVLCSRRCCGRARKVLASVGIMECICKERDPREPFRVAQFWERGYIALWFCRRHS